ncbi:MAG: deoxynucleoside kinase [Gammaproteobacteria bacterium]|nr:deoxynucleoside kinase [Gammaproteobacteria bacterium]NNJ79932.1 deoxynucleoside kinase [Xanthomonadales bacterium]
MSDDSLILDVQEDTSIRRHEIATRLTSVERRLMERFSARQEVIVCVGNIGAGKSSLVKFLAFNTGMNALFELPDEGFEDHLVRNESLYPPLSTAKDAAKRSLGRYYGAINDFIDCQAKELEGSPAWTTAKRHLENAALDIQHAYLDLRKMQLQAVPYLVHSTVVDGSALADRYAFCEVLHRDMDVPYLTKEALGIIDARLEEEFRPLIQPSLLVLLEGPDDYIFRNILERQRAEEKEAPNAGGDLPEGLTRLVTALQSRYANFVPVLRETGWHTNPVLRVDVSKIDFVSNVRHLIAVYEGIEQALNGSD